MSSGIVSPPFRLYGGQTDVTEARIWLEHLRYDALIDPIQRIVAHGDLVTASRPPPDRVAGWIIRGGVLPVVRRDLGNLASGRVILVLVDDGADLDAVQVVNTVR